MNEYIVGKGSSSRSGSSSSTATEYPDTLRSKSYVNIIDLLGEGEFEEVAVGGFQGVFLDEVPVANSDGSMNYSLNSFETRNGSLSQSRMNIASTTESVEQVGVQMFANVPVERAVLASEADVIKVSVNFPSLTSTSTSTGDVTGTTVEYKIEYRPSTTPTWTTVTEGSGIRKNDIIAKNVPSASVSNYNSYNYTATITPWGYLVDETGTVYGTTSFVVEKNVNNAGWDVVKSGTTTSKVTVSGTIDGVSMSDSVQIRVVTTDANIVTQYFAEGDVFTETITPAQGQASVGSLSSVVGTYQANNGIQQVSGKSSSAYERQTTFRPSGEAPWYVRVTRLTADSTSSYLANDTYFSSITTVLEEKLRYPGSVLVGVQVDAEQFSSIPSRSYLCKCLKVKVPTNYNPITREYVGIWEGSFKIAWTDNPAWCFYDLITNARYGLGERIPESSVDKWELYSIAQYCDVLVRGDDGVYEPRFSCNVVIQTREEAYQMINDFASVFRGMNYWGLGTIVPVQDSPKDPSYAFNNSNVVDGTFTYQSSSVSTRYNAVSVTWNNPADYYKRWVEYVEDVDAIEKLGYVNETSIVAFGCTSRAMARRVGKWLIYTNNNQTDVVTFTTGNEGGIPRPGDVILISDSLRATERRGGRLVSATLVGCVLDSEYSFVAGTVYSFSAINVEGSLVDTTFTFSENTTTNTVVFDTQLPLSLAKDSVYIFADNNIAPEQFKVVSITEKELHKYEVSAISHNPSKYEYIEESKPLDFVVLPNKVSYPVSDLKAEEVVYLQSGEFLSKIVVSWTAAKLAKRYKVYIRAFDGTESTTTVYGTSYEVFNVLNGEYIVKVSSVNVLGQESQQQEAIALVGGKNWAPNDVTGFNATYSAKTLTITLGWNAASDLDFASYEVRKGSVESTWDSATVIAVQASNTLTFASTGQSATYFVKAKDTSGNLSTNAAADSVVFSAPTPATNLTTQEELFAVRVTWGFALPSDDLRYSEIYRSTTNNLANADVVGTVVYPKSEYLHTNLQVNQNYYFWIKVYDAYGNASVFHPLVSGVVGTPEIDASNLLVQLQDQIGMPQLAAELAAPISTIPSLNLTVAGVVSDIAAIPAIAEDILIRAVDIDGISDRLLFERAVTDATINVDPETGEIQLLATANVTTDVEARLTQVETDLNAVEGSLTSTVTTVSQIDTDLVSTQSQVAQLANEVSLSASQVYVDNAVTTATEALTVDAANNIQSLATTVLNQVLGIDESVDKELLTRSRVATAEFEIASNATEIESEATARLALAAVVDTNYSALIQEQITRATADSSEATARLALASVVANGDSTNAAAIQNESTARSTADTALGSQISTLQSTVTSNNNTLTSAIQSEASARSTTDTSLSTQISTVQSSLNSSIASVQTLSQATASEVDGLSAKWGVKVQTMADGTNAVGGVELMAGTDGESVFAVLADKLLVYKPDGSGAPKQIVTLGTVNGVTALGLDGNLIVDDSIVARHLSVDSLNAIAANVQGKLTAGEMSVGEAAISDASITNAKIANAAITNAKIGNAEVDTLKIAGNAVTIPVSASGAVSAATASVDFAGQAVCIMASASAMIVQGAALVGSAELRVKRDGVVIKTAVTCHYILGDSEGGTTDTASASLSFVDYPGSGAHYYSVEHVAVNGPELRNASCGVLALGVKR